MIEAQHKWWAEKIFRPYIDSQFRKNFGSFNLINEPPAVNPDKSVLFTPNHFSWWDGFLIHKIQREFYPERTFYILMLEEQLKVYYFFKFLGAYSIKLNNPKGIVETFEYTRKILKQKKTFAAIYPQGAIEPFDKEPLTVKKGLEKFTQGCGQLTQLVPVAFKFQFFEGKHADIYVRFGEVFELPHDKKGFDDYYHYFTDNIKSAGEEAAQLTSVRRLF